LNALASKIETVINPPTGNVIDMQSRKSRPKKRSMREAMTDQPQQLTMERLQQELTPDELELVQWIARLDGKTADQFSASKIKDILEKVMAAGDLPERDLTLVLTKQSGPLRFPVDWIDETAERSGKPIAIIGGIQPKRPTTPKPQQATAERKLHEYSPTLTTRVVLRQLWDDEREIVELMARLRGLTPDQLTVQDVNLILAQARNDGDLAERYEDEADK
jgi:hypothetical protein